MRCRRSSSERWNRSWLLPVIWSLISRSRSRKRSANSRRWSVVSSLMPVVPVQLVGRADLVAVAGRVVELGLLGADDHVVGVALAEVDPRLGDRRGAGHRLRREVADEQPRLALRW